MKRRRRLRNAYGGPALDLELKNAKKLQKKLPTQVCFVAWPTQNVSQNVSQNVEDATFEIRIELKIAQATSQRLVEWTSESSRQCKWGRVLGWLPVDHAPGNLVV